MDWPIGNQLKDLLRSRNFTGRAGDFTKPHKAGLEAQARDYNNGGNLHSSGNTVNLSARAFEDFPDISILHHPLVAS